MADATSANFNSLPAGIMRAGYVTGTPDIKWTLAQLATASVTIDQGSTGSPVPSAVVRDVEPGAWSAADAVAGPWTAARPTIYTSLDNLPALEQAGWQGDVWVADYTGTPPSSPPAMPAGMTCVAVQYTDQGGGGAYDLSVVFDPYWPQPGGDMLLIEVPAGGSVPTGIYMVSGGKWHHVIDQASVTAYQGAGVQLAVVTAAEAEQLVADYPPGNPAVTVTSAVPALEGTISIAATS